MPAGTARNTLALQHHQAGHLADAEALYRRILAAHRDHPAALHLLGVIAPQSGRTELAVEWLRRAILIKTNFAPALSSRERDSFTCGCGACCCGMGDTPAGFSVRHRQPLRNFQ